jgi:hypothetical protein
MATAFVDRSQRSPMPWLAAAALTLLLVILTIAVFLSAPG